MINCNLDHEKNRPPLWEVYCKKKTLTNFNPYTDAKPTPDTFNIVHPTATNGILTPPSLILSPRF